MSKGAYYITVLFKRYHEDDDEDAQRDFPNLPLNEALLRQFSEELQGGYDCGGMAGYYQIIGGPIDELAIKDL